MNTMSKKAKTVSVASIALYALLLGILTGAIVWIVLHLLSVSTNWIWTVIPSALGHRWLYTLLICTLGGLLIGLFQQKHGIFPDTMEEVFAKLKQDGTYDYHHLPVLIIGMLLPLIFGGSLGPEAGLTGIITALCCYVGDHLKYNVRELRELEKSGFAAALGVVFRAPLFGLVNNFEHTHDEEPLFFDPKELKISKIIIYLCAIGGALLVSESLSKWFGGGHGLPHLAWPGHAGLDDWIWFPVLVAAGIALGWFFQVTERTTHRLSVPLRDHRVVSCLIAGMGMGLLGAWNPLTMFSGEAELLHLASQWQSVSVSFLILTALAKMIATNLCLSFGWKGGSIFPIIYCSASLGFALASLTGVLPLFAVVCTVAGAYGSIMRKPLTVTAVLFLCFPIRFILPLLLSAYLASIIPLPKAEKNQAEA
ncbi:MAG: chloride channel protein [Catenisphaera adipataccumulans]|jgi:H+/Cl- antiporter ClcA|uniref:chloride channel protein n=1 Tax=Catenisphaera adipataccumulans TaxID=700500 RepID=UPI003D91EC83